MRTTQRLSAIRGIFTSTRGPLERSLTFGGVDGQGHPTPIAIDTEKSGLPRKILVTNDDGPPSRDSPFLSPLLKGLVKRHQSQHGEDPEASIVVCIPATQQSWRGKSHDPFRSPVAVTRPSTSCFNWLEEYPQVSVVLCDTTPCGATNIGYTFILLKLSLYAMPGLSTI